ncbi:MAG: alanine racemase [Acidimicrobiales bacterium]
MTAPRLEVDLAAVCHNARTLVDRLGAVGIRVTGVTKALLGDPDVAEALVRGGVIGLGDSRIENLTRLHTAGSSAPRMLIRSPMLSQADDVVCHATVSLNTEALVLEALSKAAARAGSLHSVLLMVDEVEAACGMSLTTVSGGNSASIDWALTTADVGASTSSGWAKRS